MVIKNETLKKVACDLLNISEEELKHNRYVSYFSKLGAYMNNFDENKTKKPDDFKVKVLFIDGDDYAALTFEDMVRGKTLTEVIDDIKIINEKMLEEDDCFEYEIKELVGNDETFNSLRDCWGDYDYMKTKNCYWGVDYKF